MSRFDKALSHSFYNLRLTGWNKSISLAGKKTFTLSLSSETSQSDPLGERM